MYQAMAIIIAVVSDIHANLPALEAVWNHAKERGAEEIWNMGDHVGYSAFPNETIEWLIKHDAVSVLGDYDSRVLQVKKKRSEWQRSKDPIKLEGMLWSRRSLSRSNLRYLKDLPKKRTLKRKGHSFRLNHGSPAALDEGLASSTSTKRLRKLAKMVKVDAVLSGDSHRPFKREVEGVTFINPGSVGRADDGDPRASYGLLKVKRKGFKVKLYRVEYDVDRAMGAIRQAGLPEEFAQMMLQGRNFNDIVWH
jgi:putative phosphoesterase